MAGSGQAKGDFVLLAAEATPESCELKLSGSVSEGMMKVSYKQTQV